MLGDDSSLHSTLSIACYLLMLCNATYPLPPKRKKKKNGMVTAHGDTSRVQLFKKKLITPYGILIPKFVTEAARRVTFQTVFWQHCSRQCLKQDYSVYPSCQQVLNQSSSIFKCMTLCSGPSIFLEFLVRGNKAISSYLNSRRTSENCGPPRENNIFLMVASFWCSHRLTHLLNIVGSKKNGAENCISRKIQMLAHEY